jgi:glucosamine-phosphate N-acetyltransferase
MSENLRCHIAEPEILLFPNKPESRRHEVDSLKAVPMRRLHFEAVVSLLQELSVFEPSPEIYEEIWTNFSSQSNSFPLVALSEGEVVGFAVLLVEGKVRGGKMGHIEDVVSHPDFRGIGVGRLLISKLTEIASKIGCYKVALHCQEHNVGFYEKCGFNSNGSSMQKFL